MTSQPMHSTPKKFENSGTMQNGHLPNSGSGSSGVMSMSMGDLESTTSEKQRKELRLLITELKDRDRELNDMVAVHQQQLAAWERDRQRALLLEIKKEKFEAELKMKTEQIRLLVRKLKASESKHKNIDSALVVSESRMKNLEKDMSVTVYQVQDLKDKNVSLSSSLTDMSRDISTMEAREQESATAIRIKEKELRDSSDHVSTLSSKLRMLDAELQDNRHSESRSRAEIQEERSRYKRTKVEMDSLKAEMLQKTDEIFCYGMDMSKLKDEIHKLQKEIYIRDDEIRRKDDLIDLQKSKEDRTGKELAALRFIYERQQQELGALHISLSDSQVLLENQEERLNNLGDTNVQKKSVSFLIDSFQSANGSGSFITGSTTEAETEHCFDNPSAVFQIGRSPVDKAHECDVAGTEKCAPEMSASSFKSNREVESLEDSTVNLTTSSSKGLYTNLNGLDLGDFEDCGSDASNDLLDEARSSANCEILMRSEVDHVESSSKNFSHSSPTSKLQRLLAESREMVHNLELAASAPVPRPNSGRVSTGTGYTTF